MACPKINQMSDESHFSTTLHEYPELEAYTSHFQVHLKNSEAYTTTRHLKDSIVVFKKKILSPQALQQNTNIYNHDLSNIELDAQDERKARSSCLRCRKFKKKCTRDLPECLNCISCDELCIYITRKRKGSDCSNPDSHKRAKSSPATSRKSSLDSVASSISPDSAFDLVRRFSVPAKLPAAPESNEDTNNYCHYLNKTVSDVYRLLN